MVRAQVQQRHVHRRDFAPAAAREGLEQGIAQLAFHQLASDLGRKIARFDHVDVDPLARPFARHQPRHLGHPGLGGRIRSGAGEGLLRGDRADDHHAAVFLFLATRRDQAPGAFTHGQERTAQVGGDHPVKRIHINLQRQLVIGDPGIGHDCVDRAEGGLGGFIGGNRCRFIRHVERYGEGLAARRPDLCLQRREPVRPPRAHHHCRAGRCQQPREMRTKARRGAGYERYAASQVKLGDGGHASSSSLFCGGIALGHCPCRQLRAYVHRWTEIIDRLDLQPACPGEGGAASEQAWKISGSI